MLAVAYLQVRADKRSEVLALYEIDPAGPLLLIALATALVCALMRLRRGHAVFAWVLTVVLLVVSFWLNPRMNAVRSGAAFVPRIEQAADPGAELGIVAFKEQYLLHMHREIVHFGHARLARSAAGNGRCRAVAGERQWPSARGERAGAYGVLQ